MQTKSLFSKKLILTCLLIGFLFLNSFLIGSAVAKGKPDGPPPKIKGLTVTVIPEGNALELSWGKSPAKDLDHYNIYRSTTPGFVPDLENPYATSTIKDYLDTGLTDGVTYYYRVAAEDTDGNIGTPSDEKSGTSADSVAPEQVVGVVVTAIAGGTQLELTWTASTASDLANYKVYRSTTSGFTPGPGNLIASPITNYYLDTSLTNGVTYYYRITALDEVPNEGNPSDEASGTPGNDTTPPEKVVGLTITVVPTGNALDLNWAASIAPDLANYNVYRSTTSGFTPGPANLIATPTTNSYLDLGLTNGITYYYRVSAVDNSSNEGDPSDEASGTPQDTVPPEQVTGLTVTNPGTGNMLQLSWTASSAPDIMAYKVYRSTTPGFTPGPAYLIATPITNSYIDSSLMDGITYYYRVSAVDEVPNEGPSSTEKAGIPTDIVPPEKVTGVVVTPWYQNFTYSLELTWTPSTASDLVHYNVYRSNISGFIPGPANLIATPFTNFYFDLDVMQGVTYYYRISAVDEVPNEGPASDEVSGTP